MPRWAYSDAADIVEPISSIAEDGFPAGYRPPAQWFNYLLHYSLAWADHLRGPGWGSWTREDQSATDFVSVSGFAVDRADERARDHRVRYAIVGAASGPVAHVVTSKNGRDWTDRSAPTSCDALYGITCIDDTWYCWGLVGATPTTWSTPADTGSNNSAVRTGTAGHWTTEAGIVGDVRGIVSNGGTDYVALIRDSAGQFGVTASADSGTAWSFSAGGNWTSGSDRAAGIAWDDSRDRFVIASMLGEVKRLGTSGAWTTGTTTLATLTGIPTDARVHLRVGGPEDARTLIAWASHREDGTTALAATLIWRSTDGGATWTAITAADPGAPAAMRVSSGAAVVTDIQHVDGTWIATSSAAPYLWRSDDDGQNWERVPLPVAEESSWALSRAVYADGQIVCTGLSWTVFSTRASATSPGTWTSRESTYLADAGYLRGRRIHTTAPSNGQVYAWVTANNRWEPVSASSLSVTTTRGDLIRRGASADERVALGTRGYTLRAGATDPTWGVVASSESSLPTAGADYAGAIIFRTDLGAHFQCTEGGHADEWAWRVLSVHDGGVAEDTTPGNAWTTIASTQVAEDTVALLDIEVVGVKDDLSTGLVAKGYAGFVNAGGVLTEIEALSLLVGDPARVQLTTAGPDVEVQVKGVAAEDWTWRVKITRRLEVGP